MGLDLSDNRLGDFPSGVLCQLSQLQHLNLSNNLIGSIADLSLHHPTCLDQLEQLDLSNNEITSLETQSWPGGPSLRDVRLARNFIRFIGPDVFLNSSVSSL